MKIVAIMNQKGGTAKTTTAAALAVLFSRAGTRMHLVDMDPQASLTRAFGLADEADGLYHDWSWAARAQLSHLVEQALADYQDRHRHPPTGQSSKAVNRPIKRPAGY